jgi:hypothetical protein
MFKFKEVVKGDPKGANLVVEILNRYSRGEYSIGRFRVYYTTDTDPLNFGMPASVAASVAKAPGARNEADNKAIQTYVAENDEELGKRLGIVYKESRPLPSDPHLNTLNAALVTAELPVIEPLPLAQVRQDTHYSIQQAANRRLTATQDLVWALVNSPSFLFNR